MRSERGDGGGVVSPDVYSLGLKKWEEKREGRWEKRKRQNGANHKLEVEREQREERQKAGKGR